MIPAAGSPLEEYSVICGLDSEWERNGSVPARNQASSYQWTALHQKAPGDWELCEGIHYVENDQRLTAGQYLGKVLSSFGIGHRTAKKKRVLLLGHFTLADLSLFADRETFNKRFQEIRHTLVTLRGHANVKASFEGRHAAEVCLTLRDTMLLAPQKQASLEAIGQYTKHKKLIIDQYWKEHMLAYRDADPVGYAAYAINDTRVALEYYVNVVDALVKVTGVRAIPLTIGGAAMAGFVHWHGGHNSTSFQRIFGKEDQEYINALGHLVTRLGKCPMRLNSERIAGESYMGGLNTAYESSTVYTSEPGTVGAGSIILDIDFANAYPTALAAVPAVDWTARPRYIDRVGQIQAFFNPTKLRELGFVPNIVGHVAFEFPEDVEYPCLPVRYGNGLFYPRRGQTYCTGVEMDAAIRLGARIELKEVKYFPILRREDTSPLLPFAGYLAMLVDERQNYAPGTLYNMLYKEMANSLYGKGAQGIEERTRLNHYDEADGSTKRKRLPESQITVPHFAALCTGMVRAALSMVVARLAECPGFRVLSATTDGCMLVAPRRFDPDMLPMKNGKVDPEKVDLLGLYPEIRALEQSPAIVAMLLGRRALGQSGPWAVIKHIGDHAETMRTRVNSLSYKGVEQHVAHTGIDTTETSLAALHRELGLVTQRGTRLPSTREMTTGAVADFVEIEYERTINTDYDYKRRLFPDGRTLPFADKAEFSAYRDAAYRLRKKDAVRATAERVDAKVAASQAGMHALPGEGNVDVYRRYVHKAIAHGFGEWGVYAKGKDIASMLGIDYENQYKSYRKREFEPQRFQPSDLLHQVASEEAQKVGKVLTPAMYNALTM
jgi:hypothetical protein